MPFVPKDPVLPLSGIYAYDACHKSIDHTHCLKKNAVSAIERFIPKDSMLYK